MKLEDVMGKMVYAQDFVLGKVKSVVLRPRRVESDSSGSRIKQASNQGTIWG